MLNTTTNNSTSFNAPATGVLQKSHEGSFFINCHYTSQMAKAVLCDKPKYGDKDIIVLQVMLTHGEYMLVEVMEGSRQ